MAVTYNQQNLTIGNTNAGYPVVSAVDNTYNPNVKDHMIRGQLISVDVVYDMDMSLPKDFEARVKFELVQKIAEEMFKSNAISFTKQTEPQNYKTHYRAYAYITSNGDVEVIRQHLKDKK